MQDMIIDSKNVRIDNLLKMKNLKKINRIGKKAQLKIQQMSFMLIAVFILFALVGLFYLSYKTLNLQKQVIDLRKEKTQDLVVKIASNPELIYESRGNSIDADKLMLLRGKDEYKKFWGIKGIIVEKIYPASPNVECKLSNYPECSTIKLFTTSNSAPIYSFVSLCRKESQNGRVYDKCELAKIMLEIDNEVSYNN
ncbi:MAG: hypothetical protein AABX03_04445 [Nanoarchaeota archaeon]